MEKHEIFRPTEILLQYSSEESIWLIDIFIGNRTG